jgi:toxin ParE1/3/4
MARQIIWSPRASDALEETCNYISRDSGKFACIFAQRVIQKIEQLYELPEIGRIVPEFNDPNLRELILGNYRIVYRLAQDYIEIALIIHGARLLHL